MDSMGWILLLAVVAGAVWLWWRRGNSAEVAPKPRAAAPAASQDRRRGPRRVTGSRRENFRMGADETDRRSGQDRRKRNAGWDDDVGGR